MLYHPCGFVSFFSNDVKFHATFVYAGRPRHVPSLAVMYAFCRGRSTIESEFSPFSAMPVARATWPPQLLHTTSVTNIVWCDVMANVDGLTLPMPSAMTGLPGVRTCLRPNVTPLTVLGVGSPGAGGRSEVALNVGELRVADATAFSLCMDNDMPILVFNLLTDGNIARAVAGEHIGTLVRS